MVEAQSLGRIFLMPAHICLPALHNFGNEQIMKPIEHVLDLALLRSANFSFEVHADIEEYVQSLLPAVSIARLKHEVPPDALRQYAGIEVLARLHRLWEADPRGWWGYREWWTPCESDRGLFETFKSMKGLWRPAQEVQRVSKHIIEKLGGAGGNFCSLHVRRGDKLAEVPGLDEATRPPAIVQSLRGLCPPGRTLYIASNEQQPGFFEPLREHYPRLYTFRDFGAQLAQLGAVELDARGEVAAVVDNLALYQVEVEVQEAARQRMDTFCVLFHVDAGRFDCGSKAGLSIGAYGIDGVYGLVG